MHLSFSVVCAPQGRDRVSHPHLTTASFRVWNITVCAVNMSGSWFMTPEKTHTGPTLGFLPNNLFPINPSAISNRELLVYMVFTLCITWTPTETPHPSFQGLLPSEFCYQAIQLSTSTQRAHSREVLLRKQSVPMINSPLPWNALFFVLNSTVFLLKMK